MSRRTASARALKGRSPVDAKSLVASPTKRTWKKAFARVAEDKSLLGLFVAALERRRKIAWLPEHRAVNDIDAARQALAFAVTTALRPALPDLPKLESSDSGLMFHYCETFNKAASTLIDDEGVEYLNSWLQDSGDKTPEAFVDHVVRNYIARNESGTRTNDPW